MKKTLLSKLYLLTAAVLTAASLCSCAGAAEDTESTALADGITFTDDLNREVTVQPPERVAVLTSSFADIWTTAGGSDTIVATTDATWRYFDLPLNDDVVNLGLSTELSLEQLIACKPDLVLASCGNDRSLDMEELLSKMKIPAAYFSVDDIDDYLRMLHICTQLTGQEERYVTYGTAVKQQVEDVLQRVEGVLKQEDDSRPSVLYIRASGSSCKVKNSKDSVLGEMLLDLGCDNIADREDSLLEQLSIEVILEEDPDYIFVILQSADISKAETVLQNTLLSNPAWSTLTAVKEERYYIMDPSLYNLKPNARWGEAYEKLAAIIYPEE